MLGLGQTSALCFVIDTTASMSDDTAKLRKVTSAIIKSKTANALQPLEYILVTFNDPGKIKYHTMPCYVVIICCM